MGRSSQGKWPWTERANGPRTKVVRSVASLLQGPHPHGVVPIADKHTASIRGEGNAHRASRARQAAELLSGLQVPQANGAVPGCGEGTFAVRGKGDGPDVILVPFEFAQLL